MSVETFLNPLNSEGRAPALRPWGLGLRINNPHPTIKGEHYVQNGNHLFAEIISQKPAFNAKAQAKDGQSALKAVLIW
tara:strand:- start:3476 stop:3709 length:234 start_codon:yes stop_codon:yes gene_type:complete